MPNIMEYLTWRGDLNFNQVPINEVDKIILARFSYLPFKDIKIDDKETIESIASKMKRVEIQKFIWKDDKKFIEKIGNTQRYKDLIVSDYSEIVELDTQKQFAAITIWLPNKYKYISFRGTDTSIVGWKEDFNMSFMKNVPSQKEAVRYLNQVGRKYKNKLILGGHSKGGNLAVYSALFCDKKIKRKIIDIINADGPGFDKSVTETENYKELISKISTYIPQSSVIGMLLEHEEQYQVVKSAQKGIMQHDIYSWQVSATDLIYVKELTNNSKVINKVIRDWLKNITPEQRENIINIIYDITLDAEAQYLSDFKIDIPKRIKKIVSSYKNINSEDKKEIEKIMKLLFEITIKTLKRNRI